jgi:hypothetical protein
VVTAKAFCALVFLLPALQQGPADPRTAAPSANVIVMTPAKVDFGPQSVGVISQPQAATITNTGTRALVIRDVTASGIDFRESDDCQKKLAPGAGCAIQVTFTPAITGPRMGTVIITGDDPQGPHLLVLNGIGQ